MIIVWNYGAVAQTEQGCGPAWNWSGPAGAVATGAVVCGTASVTTRIGGTVSVAERLGGTVALTPRTGGTVSVVEC